MKKRLPILLFFCFGPLFLFAQDQSTAPKDTVERVLTIPLTKVGDKVLDLKSYGTNVSNKSNIKKLLPSIDTNLVEVHDRLDSLVPYTNYVLQFGMEQTRISDTRAKWNRLNNRVSSINKEIEKVLLDLQKALESIQEEENLWVATKKESDSLSMVLFGEQFESALNTLDSFQHIAEDSLVVVLAYKNELNNIVNTIQLNTNALQDFQSNFLKQIWVRSISPIFAGGEMDSTLLEDKVMAENLVQDYFEDSKIYLKNEWNKIYLLIGLSLLFYLIGSFLPDIQLTKRIQNPSTVGLKAWSTKRLTSSVFISLLIVLYSFQDPPPFFVLLVFMAFVLVSFNLYSLSIKKRGVLLFAILWFPVFFIGFFLNHVVLDPYTKRWYFVLLNLLSISLISYFMMKSKEEKVFIFPYESPFGKALSIGFFWFVIVLLLNLGGFLRLSLYLDRFYIQTFFVATELYIVTCLLLGFILGIFRIHSIRNSEIVLTKRTTILNILFSSTKVLFFYLGVEATLNLAGVRDIFFAWIFEIIEKEWEFGSTSITIESILLFVVTILVSMLIANVVQLLLEKEVLKRLNLKKGIPMAIALVTRYGLIMLGFFLALGAAGIKLDRIGYIVGALGVGIGFGLQNIVSNFVSGLILIFERPINKGDTVTVGTLWGKVLDIGIRASKIRTFDGAEVVVPNNDFVAKEVVNWTLTDSIRRIKAVVPVHFDNDPGEVMAIMLNAVRQAPGAIHNPKPFGVFDGYENGVLNFHIYVYTTGDVFSMKSEAYLGIHKALAEKGISVSKPNMGIEVKDKNEPEEPPFLPNSNS